MNRLALSNEWPESWKSSHFYDQMELWGEGENLGYISAYQNRASKTLAMISSVAQPGARILDIAAAQGNFSIRLAEMGYQVTWNDLRLELADYVRLKSESTRLHFAPGNAFDLEFEEPFDGVLITEVIEHVAHPDQFLTQVASLLKPGGWIIMTTPNGAYFKNELPKFSDCPDPEKFESVQFKPNSDGHIFLLWPDELTNLAQKIGLHVERVAFFTSPLMSGHLKLETALRFLPQALVHWVDWSIDLLPKSLSQRLFIHAICCYRKPE